MQHSFAGTLRLMTSGWKQQTGFCWTLCLIRVLRTRATWLGHQAMSANIVGSLIPDFLCWELLGQVAPKFIRKSLVKKVYQCIQRVIALYWSSPCCCPGQILLRSHPVPLPQVALEPSGHWTSIWCVSAAESIWNEDKSGCS